MEKFDNHELFLKKQLLLSYYNFFSHVNYRAFKIEQSEFELANKPKSLEEKIEYDKIIFESHILYTEKIRHLLDVYFYLNSVYDVRNIVFENREEYLETYYEAIRLIDILLYQIKGTIFAAIDEKFVSMFNYIYEMLSVKNNKKIEEAGFLYVDALNCGIDEGKIDFKAILNYIDNDLEVNTIEGLLDNDIVVNKDAFIHSKNNIGFMK